MQVLVSLEVFVESPQIEGGPQHIVISNHPGHYLKISELELPQHLFTETTSPCGATNKLIALDELVSWADQGRGDAIFRLCHTVYEQKFACINAWERDRIQQLEDELMSAGNDGGMSGSKYVNVKHYHTTLEDVAREAALKRANIKKSMFKQQAVFDTWSLHKGLTNYPG